MNDAADSKFCKKCKKRKPISEFHTSKTSKGGLNTQCKQCVNGKKHLPSMDVRCSICDVLRTPRRVVRLDGQVLCYTCWQDKFK